MAFSFFVTHGIEEPKFQKNKLKSGYQVLRASETFSYIVWQFITFFTVSVISEQFHCSATSGKLWWT